MEARSPPTLLGFGAPCPPRLWNAARRSPEYARRRQRTVQPVLRHLEGLGTDENLPLSVGLGDAEFGPRIPKIKDPILWAYGFHSNVSIKWTTSAAIR